MTNYKKTINSKFYCKVCGYTWKTNKSLKSNRPKYCAGRACRSILWNRGLADCKFYINKKYQQQPIKAEWDFNGCLISIGNPRGVNQKYHSIRREGKQWLLHRWVFYNYYGYEPSEEVMHLCNNTDCINPLHLRAGTHQENEEYKVLTNRSPKGEKNPMSKLTLQKVLLIKKELKHYQRGMLTSMANRYNVNPTTIFSIKSGKNWK